MNTQGKTSKQQVDDVAGQGTFDKIKGKADELLGAAKAKIGEVTGNDRLQAEGEMQRGSGKGQHLVGEAKEFAEKVGDRLSDAADAAKAKASEAKEKAEDLYDKAKDKVSDAVETAKTKASGFAAGVKGAANDARDSSQQKYRR